MVCFFVCVRKGFTHNSHCLHPFPLLRQNTSALFFAHTRADTHMGDTHKHTLYNL